MRHAFLLPIFLLATPAAATEYEIARDGSTGARVWAEYVSGNLILRTDGPLTTLTLFQFDVNHNGRVDRRYDRQYGFLDSGKFCSDFLLTNDSSTPCGVAPSTGQGTVSYRDGSRRSRIILRAAEVTDTARRFTIQSSIWNGRTKSYYRKTVEFRPEAPTPVVEKAGFNASTTSTSPASNAIDALAADLDHKLKAIPLSFDFFQNNAPPSPVQSLITKGCITTLTTSAWGRAVINWGQKGTRPSRAYPQSLGTVDASGTMVRFDIQGMVDNPPMSQLLSDKRFEPQFIAMEQSALRLWQACGGR